MPKGIPYGFASKKEYNLYQRAYQAGMNRKPREKKIEPIEQKLEPKIEQKTDVEIVKKSEKVEESPIVSQLGISPEAMKLLKAELKKDDVKTIDRIEKWAPIVLQFLQGMQARAAETQRAQPQQIQQVQQIRAPSGWEGATPLQRFSKKYLSDGSLNPWYAAGERFEEMKMGGEYVVESFPVQNNGHYAEPRNLEQLSRKHPEPPIVNNSPPPQQEVEKPVEQNDAAQQLIVQESNQYIELVANSLNSMEQKEFEKIVSGKKDLVAQYKTFFPFIPLTVKLVIQNTPKEEFIELFKSKCAEKYKWLEEQKKTAVVGELFEKFKGELK